MVELNRFAELFYMVIELTPHKLYVHNLCTLPEDGQKVDLPRNAWSYNQKLCLGG